MADLLTQDKMSPAEITLGVIADTHIPDRAKHLHPQIQSVFQQAGVSAILHAGDISIPNVLKQLSRIAPVYAIRGNRDWLFIRSLPLTRCLSFNGATIILTHGHGRWNDYILDRIYYMLHGYHLERFSQRLLNAFPQAQAIVFGHTHRPLNLRLNGLLLFNPGSPHFPEQEDQAPSVGLLHIPAGGHEVQGEIIELSPLTRN
jgi:putative phosphoesterase